MNARAPIDTLPIAERLTHLRYKVAVVGSVIKDQEADRSEKEGAGFLIIEIQDELEAIGWTIHPSGGFEGPVGLRVPQGHKGGT